MLNQVTFIYIAHIQYWLCQQEDSLSRTQEDYEKEAFFQLKWFRWWFSDVIIQFSSLPIVSVQSVKCPQLSTPKVTAARTQNSICDGTEKKPGSVGGQFHKRL